MVTLTTLTVNVGHHNGVNVRPMTIDTDDDMLATVLGERGNTSSAASDARDTGTSTTLRVAD